MQTCIIKILPVIFCCFFMHRAAAESDPVCLKPHRCYLKGLEEASSSSTSIFKFVVIASDTHHGLAVQVKLLIKGL